MGRTLRSTPPASRPCAAPATTSSPLTAADALVEAIERADPDAAVRATAGYLDACEHDLRRLTPASS